MQPIRFPALSSAGGSLAHHAPFPHPAHRTGQAHFSHPAPGERLTSLHTEICGPVPSSALNPAHRAGRHAKPAGSPAISLCAWPTATDAAFFGHVHRPVGFTDRTEAEVIGPTNQHPIEASYHRCLIQQGFVPSGFAADCLTD